MAAAASSNLLAGLAGKKVWLLSTDDDEHAGQADNATLFEAIPSQDKQHLRFAGGHLLPASYVEGLLSWF